MCDGTGMVSLDVKFLPDVDIPCPECHGARYGKDAYFVRCRNKSHRLEVLDSLCLGYLAIGEAATSFSGGEAQPFVVLPA